MHKPIMLGRPLEVPIEGPESSAHTEFLLTSSVVTNSGYSRAPPSSTPVFADVMESFVSAISIGRSAVFASILNPER